jgi:HSP20 family protein
LIETEKAYHIELAAPGLEKKDFSIELQDGMLHIRAEKEEEQSEEDKNYRRKEFSYFSFSRSFALPDNLLVDKIEASYTHGILHLTLPKKEVIVSKPVKQIKVG